MFYNVFYNIIKLDITEKACLVVLHGLAGADAQYILSTYWVHTRLYSAHT